MKNPKIIMIASLFFLSLLFSCGKSTHTESNEPKIVYYNWDCLETLHDIHTLTCLPEMQFLQHELQAYQIEDFMLYRGGLVEVQYDEERPVSIDIRYKNKNQDSTFVYFTKYFKNKYTRMAISYEQDTAKLAMSYHGQPVPFHLDQLYFTSHISYHFDDSKKVKQIKFYFLETGYESAVVNVTHDPQRKTIAYRTTTGLNLSSKVGIHKIAYKYDSQGNMIEKAFFNINDEPMFLRDFHYSVVRWKYDGHGNRVEEAYFGTKGEPVFCRLTESKRYAMIKWKYDKRNNSIEESYFDINGRPINHSNSRREKYTIVRSKYNDKNLLAEKAYFNGQGLPASNHGAATITINYDSMKNPIETLFFDENGNPISANIEPMDLFRLIKPSPFHVLNNLLGVVFWGTPIIKIDFDNYGNPVQMNFIESNNTGIEVTQDSGKKVEIEYDLKGNITKLSISNYVWLIQYDEYDRPVIYDDGISNSKLIEIYQYDKNGNISVISFVDLNNQLTDVSTFHTEIVEELFDEYPGAFEYGATIKLEYDSYNLLNEMSYFDANQYPVESGFFDFRGYSHIARWHYDIKGNVTERSFYDNENKLFLPKDSYSIMGYKHQWAKKVMKYDELGNDKIEEHYIDVNNEPFIPLAQAGYIRKFKYDGRGNEIKWEDYGLDGQPTSGNFYNAGEAYLYDENSCLFEEWHIDTEGKLVNQNIEEDNKTYPDVAKIKYVRDLYCNELEKILVGKNGSIIAKFKK